MMRVHNHGGRCCGIKHILNFSYSPNDMVSALPTRKKVYNQGAASEMTAGKDFYKGPEPMEPGIVRLDKLLKDIDARKSGHLVEVTLNKYQNTVWQEPLEKRGFKQVTRFYNSNTGGDYLRLPQSHTFTVAQEEGEVMKKLVQVEEVSEEGLFALMGKRVTFFCMNYIYTGTLTGVNDACVRLEDAAIVYETGSLTTKDWQEAQKLPHNLYVQLSAVEAFCELK